MAGLSPFQPCCPCQPPFECCHCTDSPRQLTVDIGVGGWSDKRCNNCAAVAGEFTLDYNAAHSLSGCVWDYYDDNFCADSDLDCPDPWRLYIYFRIIDNGDDTCNVALHIHVACFFSPALDPPTTDCDGAEGCSQTDSIEWGSFEADNLIAVEDMECDTADWPLSFDVRTPRDDCERNVLVTCPCWDTLPTPLSVDEV